MKILQSGGLRARFAALAFLSLLPFALPAATPPASDAVRVEKRGEFEFRVAPAPDWVVERDVPATWDAKAPGTDERSWRYWLLDAQVDRRGTRRGWYDQAFEPVSPELVSDAARYEIPFVPEYQRMTLHRVAVRRDGKWSDRLVPASITLARRETEFESDMATGEVAALVVIEDVRAGDVVRVSYSLEGSNPVLAGMTNEHFGFGWTSPILDRTLRVLFPAGTQVASRNERGAPAATVRREGDHVLVSAAAHGAAAIEDDGEYPAWYSPWPMLQVGEQRTWADVARWARKIYPAPEPLPAELATRLVEWRKLPREAGALAALRAVQEEVRYFGAELGENTHRPSQPAETWRRRYGDCKDKALLLATLLRELGYDAEPALVSAGNGRGVRDWLPGGDAFDHVIVRARDGERTWWLDATQTQQRGTLDRIDVGDFGVALPVADGFDALVNVVSGATSDDKRVTERWQPGADGRTVELTVTTTVTGSLADDMRRELSTGGREALEKRYADYYRRAFGDLEVIGKLESSDDEHANRIEVVERYRLLKPWAAESSEERAIDVFADSIGDDVQLPRAT
ncbi:MAG TPA: DUF3857 domain-containing protein, partial [Xanthomonadales bacterium]|nr:DUF3857 domain-containing protein [Xanthomonadales bacterium]